MLLNSHDYFIICDTACRISRSLIQKEVGNIQQSKAKQSKANTIIELKQVNECEKDQTDLYGLKLIVIFEKQSVNNNTENKQV